MAKKNMIAREVKREAVVARDAAKREALKKIIKDPNVEYDAKMDARDKLNKMDRNGAIIRRHRRCVLTGRPHGNLRHFNLCRIKVREMASEGLLPGVKKSSW